MMVFAFDNMGQMLDEDSFQFCVAITHLHSSLMKCQVH